MIKKAPPTKRRKRDHLEDRTYQEDPEQLSDDEVRRQLGSDLLPINGGDREVQD